MNIPHIQKNNSVCYEITSAVNMRNLTPIQQQTVQELLEFS